MTLECWQYDLTSDTSSVQAGCVRTPRERHSAPGCLWVIAALPQTPSGMNNYVISPEVSKPQRLWTFTRLNHTLIGVSCSIQRRSSLRRHNNQCKNTRKSALRGTASIPAPETGTLQFVLDMFPHHSIHNTCYVRCCVRTERYFYAIITSATPRPETVIIIIIIIIIYSLKII